MTYSEEQELLKLTKENNEILKIILQYVRHDNMTDLFTNIVANMIGNRIDGGRTYAKY